MNKKQKLTAFALSLSLFASSSALAYGNVPQSQFGFKGWPYRQNSNCFPQTSPVPTAAPTAKPTVQPTAVPTAEPTVQPTAVPTAVPTIQPTAVPTAVPTVQPTAVPTAVPTVQPTAVPTAAPTPKPTATPKPVATQSPSNGDDYTTPSISVQEENAFILLNQDRIANGLPALKLDPELSRIARAKSKDMNDRKYFSHTSPTYGTASEMLRKFGYSFVSVGENIAHHSTVEKSQAAFMSSSGHRRNILGSQWSKVGIGVWKDAQGFVYVTQLFVR